jgi:serine-aspartate repeat-containing protein C/D/E
VTPNAAFPLSSTPTSTTDDDIDGNDDGTQTASGDEAKSAVIALTVDGEVDNEAAQGDDTTGHTQDDADDNNGNMTVDFGFVGLGSLSGNVSHEDGDGVLHPMRGVTLVLYDANGNEVARTTTDEHGNYLFEDLRLGNYTVVELQPDGYFDVRENAGGADDDNSTQTPPNVISATVDGGENDLENDFVEAHESSLGDYVWYDDDNDGVQDAEEAGVEGVMVILTDEDGNKYTATTDDQGAYRFDHLDPTKVYSVEYNLTTLPEGYDPTRADLGGDDTTDSDADEQGRVDAVTLRPGEHNPTIDMGIRPEGATGDRQYLVGTHFWVDNDDNGIYDPDVDTPIKGATVTLYHADGTPVLDEDGNPLVTTTGPDGAYHFYVEEGDYYVQFTLPQSYIDEGYDFVDQADNADNGINRNTTGRDGISQTVHVGPNGRSADLTLDAAVNCACSGITSDGGDSLSFASLLFMMFMTLSAGLFFVRREEQ